MVRLRDLPEDDRRHMLAKTFQRFAGAPFVRGTALSQRRVAVVTTAAVQMRDEAPFDFQTAEYKIIPGDIDGADLVMSHTSVNFDRTGFQHDVNVVFPIDRLRELQDQGAIGSLARYHYAFCGAYMEPEAYADTAREVAGLLRGDNVDAVLLVPV